MQMEKFKNFTEEERDIAINDVNNTIMKLAAETKRIRSTGITKMHLPNASTVSFLYALLTFFFITVYYAGGAEKLD